MGVKHVKQLDDKHLHWKAEIGGKEKEWNAEITEQIPDQRIAWKSTSGAMTAGIVTFIHVSPAKTKVMLKMEHDPKGMVENVGDAVGFVTHKIQGDLERFKQFIETRGQETGAWRGTVSSR